MRNLRKTFLSAVAVLLALGAVISCSKAVRTVSVKPPFEKVNVAYEVYNVDPVKGGEVRMPNGTRIMVPEKAFVDAKGKLITEPVELKYREFHTQADIIASGIPMVYDSAGQTCNFESAGMFDINAFAGSTPVFIADNKNLSVEMASFKPGDDFNFYYYDPQSNNWECQGRKTAETNREKQEEIKVLAETPDLPVMPEKVDKNTPVFNLDVNYSLYPELKEFDGIMWRFAGMNPKQNPDNNPWLFEEDWKYVELNALDKEKALYKLHLNAGNRAFETVVKPVLKGADYEKALAKFKLKMGSYEQAITIRKQEVDRLQRQADLVRSFEVSQFGIYNWDRIYKQPLAVPVTANFEFDKKVDKNAMTVYLISGKDRAVVTYYPGSENMFCYNPKDRNCLLAVLPGDKLAIFDNNEFEKLDPAAIRGTNHTFKLRTVNKTVASVDELNEFIRGI
jgi:hypothetical protein